MLHLLVKNGTQKEIDKLNKDLSDIRTGYNIRQTMEKIRVHKKIAFVRKETPNPKKLPLPDEYHFIDIPSWTFQDIRKHEDPKSESYSQIKGLDMAKEGFKTFTDTNPFVLVKKKKTERGKKPTVDWYLKPTGENRLQMIEYNYNKSKSEMLLPIEKDYCYKLQRGKTYGVLVGLNTLVVIRLESMRLPETPVQLTKTTPKKLSRSKSGPVGDGKPTTLRSLISHQTSEVTIGTVDV